MEKINIAEILKDCPKGTKLYTTVWGDVKFIKYNSSLDLITISVHDSVVNEKLLYGDGSYKITGECILFPSKENRNWSKFQRPFKDGDIIFTHANCLKVGIGNTWISIYKENRNGGVATYVDCTEDGDGYYSDLDGDKAFLCMEEDILRQRFATEEEKQKLFQAIKNNGYKWNAETKTLEKLIIPKFKAGDKIEKCSYRFTITEVKEDYYLTKCGNKIPIENQDDFNLISDKFNINTLKPFDKVLVRDTNNEKWKPALWGFYDIDNAMNYPYECYGAAFAQCIPYEGNEHLRGKTDDCSSFFKTWE